MGEGEGNGRKKTIIKLLFTTFRNFFTVGAFYEREVQTDLSVPVMFLPQAYYFFLEMVSLIKCPENACDQWYQSH